MSKETADLWSLLYLHDWDEGGKVYPEIYGVYQTEREAIDAQRKMMSPSKYWVRRARMIR